MINSYTKGIGVFAAGYITNKFLEENFMDTLKLYFDPNHITKIKNPTLEQHFIVMNNNNIDPLTYLENLENVSEELYVKMLSTEKTNNTLKMYLEKHKNNIHLSNYLKWKFINHDPNFIKYISNQTEEMALYVLKKDARLLTYIENKTEDVYLQFIDTFRSNQYREDDSTTTRLEDFQSRFNFITPNIIKRLNKYGYKISKNNDITYDPLFISKL